MAINFPTSPSTNDTFTAGSITYKWDGVKWIGLGVTPTDRLIEGSNKLEINANNDLVWTGEKVGVNEDNPDRQLSVYHESNSGVEIKSNTDGQSSVFFTDTADGNIGMIGYTHNNDEMFFRVNDQTRLSIDSSGTLIASSTGTFSPYVADANLQITDDTNAKLVISNPGNSTYSIAVGTDNYLSFRNESQARTDMVIDYTTGNVGIGSTTSPRTELDLFDGQLSFSHRTDYSIRFYNGTGNNWSAILNPSVNDGTNSSALSFKVATGEALRIDTAGEVTTPRQPAFIARYSVNETTWNVATDGWTKIPFDEEMMDRGSDFSTANSEFTAPVTGTYLFGAELQLESPNGITSGYLTSGSNWMYVTFVVNGATTIVESKGGTRTDANFNAMYNSYTPTHLLNLTGGDTVCMYRTGNYTSIKFKGGAESVFWGYLVG